MKNKKSIIDTQIKELQNKHLVLIYNPLYEKIKEYCDFNGIKVTPFVNELLNKQFSIEKYGESPFSNSKEIETLKSVVKDVTQNKETASQFLKSAGIMNENGELDEKYRNEDTSKDEIENVKVFSHPGHINENIVYDDTDKFQETVIQKPKKRKLK